jgi:hypothetical protein
VITGTGASAAVATAARNTLPALIGSLLVFLLDVYDGTPGVLGIRRALMGLIIFLARLLKRLQPAQPLQPSLGDALDYALAQAQEQARLLVRYPVSHVARLSGWLLLLVWLAGTSSLPPGIAFTPCDAICRCLP